jgi:polar amino acid transport system substrate-binding protein
MLAEALGVDLELTQITGANRVPFLATDKLDLVISAMGATPERALQVAFSSPYSALSIGVFGPAEIAVAAPGEIGGHTIGVARGTTQDIELTALAPDATIQRFEDDATAAAAYLSGQVELFATANIVAQDLAKKHPDKGFEPKFIIRFSPTHIAFQQGNPELGRWLDTFVFYNKLNGKLDELSRKWLGTPLPENLPSL